MTVADRRATPRPSGPLATRLGVQLSTARSSGARSRLISTTSPIDDLDPIAVFAAARALDLEAALWFQPGAGRSIVGIGRAWAVETAGTARFSEATVAWRTVLANALRSGESVATPAAGPILLGGLGFSGRTPERDDSWAPFGAASLVLPTFGLVRDAAGSYLTVAVGPEELDDVDPARLDHRWDSLRHAAQARGRDANPAGRSAGAAGRPPTPTLTEEGRHLRVIDERPDRAGWDRTVGLFAGAVGRGRIDKVVLARRVMWRADAELDIEAALRHLARSAPESTTFAFVRDGTTFLGATPERLVRTAGRLFETVAIAGSAARGSDPDDDARLAAALLASEKDREEHAVVVDMLRASLAPISTVLRVAETPAILPLRHVQHLVTSIAGTLREDAGLLELGERLHPTPAVGGAPRQMALDLIAEHEGFDRGWYAGPIGWLGADGHGELMVALRCGLVRGTDATAFAGCGIVADSDPAGEWEESRLKLRTMTGALGGAVEDDR